MAEAWEIALFLVGLLSFLLLSAFIYYRTSDDYKLKKRRRELGYEVEDWTTSLLLCCQLCIGPVNRKRWEMKHKLFRTPDYGPPDRSKARPELEPS